MASKRYCKDYGEPCPSASACDNRSCRQPKRGRKACVDCIHRSLWDGSCILYQSPFYGMEVYGGLCEHYREAK